MWKIKIQIESCLMGVGDELSIKFDHTTSKYKLYKTHKDEQRYVGFITSDIDDMFDRLSEQQVYNLIGMKCANYSAKVFAITERYALANLVFSLQAE